MPNRNVLDTFTDEYGLSICVTQDTDQFKCIRIHYQSKDSLGNPCWRQVACTHPRHTDNVSRDAEKEAIHSVMQRYLELCQDITENNDERL